MDIEKIILLVNEFKKEELPNSEEPYHNEAEISAGLNYFVEWLKLKNK